MGENLQVTANSGLNVRGLPSLASQPLAAMPKGMVVEALDPLVWDGRWRRIRAWFTSSAYVEGYSAAAYLQQTSLPASNQPGAAPPAPSPKPQREEVPEARSGVSDFALQQLSPMTEPWQRRRHFDELHDAFRAKLEALMNELARRGLRFKVLEAYRQPDRQAELFNQETKVTNADAWQSMHNYGLAADLVLDIPGIGLWEDGRVRGHNYHNDWMRMRDVARRMGMHVLTRNGEPWDLPHVQFDSQSWRIFHQGEFPPGGGATWEANLLRNINAYPRNAPTGISQRASGGDALVPEEPNVEDEQLV
ncbi:MAG: hypothetical protein AAGI11_23165 [Pseudomonadota bacterium]